MQGFNVLSPMGWDSFGLPAENRAIETGIDPRSSVEDQIGRMKQHFRQLGAAFDWSRELASHEPSFYKWDQWLFLELFDRGLAYKARAPVNWCPRGPDRARQRASGRWRVRALWDHRGEARARAMVLQDHRLCGASARSDRASRPMAGAGANDAAKLDRPFRRRRDSRSRSKAPICHSMSSPPVPDTIFGMTFCVLAPEHPLVESLISGSEAEEEARAYIAEATRASEIERMAEGEKTGVFTGANAVNPVNGRAVPIYIADYVLMGYGTGAIMAVPGQDQRDWDFATRYGLDIIRTVEPPLDWEGQAYPGEGDTINSGFLDGLDQAEAKAAIIAWLEEQGLGEGTVQYRLRDWLISRQRYWGCPIPMIECPDVWPRTGAGNRTTGAATGGRGLCPIRTLASGDGRRIRQHDLPEVRRTGPARDRHHGHLRRLVVVLPALYRSLITRMRSSIERRLRIGCPSTGTSVGWSTPSFISSMPGSSPDSSTTSD